MDVLSHVLSTFKVQARVYFNAQICGEWQIDTSGTRKAALHAVTHGNCILQFSDGTFYKELLEPGDVVFLPRDLKCRICSKKNVTTKLNDIEPVPFADGIQSDGTGLVCAHITFEHYANNFLFDMLPEYLVIKSGRLPWNANLRPIIDIIKFESVSDNPGVQETLNRLTEMAVLIIMREYIKDESNQFGFAVALRDPNIYKVLDAIHNNLEKDFNLSQLADISLMSKSALESKFKLLLGTSPINYLKQWRMRSAYVWLRDENITITEAANRCNYKNESSFSKAFKKELGFSPGHVRKSNKQLTA